MSVLSLFKPKEVKVYNIQPEPHYKSLVLQIDGLPHHEYFIGTKSRFDVRLNENDIVILVVGEDGKTVKKKTVDKSSVVSFITQDKKRYYNKYIVEIDKKVSKRYEGILEITSIGDTLQITLSAKEEDIVASVTESEIGSYSSFEALKAQAVLVRTFLHVNSLHANSTHENNLPANKLISYNARHKDKDYDFCDTTHCQFYKGSIEPGSKAFKAAVETKGEIITYDGAPIYPYYFSACGGYTAKVSTIWGAEDKSYPYLKPVKCDRCTGSKFYRYERKVKIAELADIFLQKDDKSLGVKVNKYDDNKHWVDSVSIVSLEYQNSIKGDKFRLSVGRALGWNRLPSNAFTIKKEGDSFKISGKGFGHGVGLCQTGADKMAGSGADYKDIIKHYFSRVKIQKLITVPND
jgi:stage II sporulation protein D